VRQNVFLTALLVSLLSIVGAIVSLHTIYRVRPSDTLHDALFVSSPQAAKKLSLGYSGLLADVYWTRVVQYFGGKHKAGTEEYKALAPLLNITVTLDPHLLVAYQFGSIFLAQQPPDGAGDVEAALALIKRGIRANPDYWRLYYSLGYLEYDEKHDFKAAAEAFEEGAKKTGAHQWMKTMAARMHAEAGDMSTARYLWSRIYEETEDQNVRQNAFMRLGSLKIDEEVPQLEKLVSQYHQKTGHWPSSWREMISVGLLKNPPVDPAGEVYLLKPEGRVEVANPKLFRFAHHGVPGPAQPI
jgi:tetratricopeptide (TPR) repeat protein